MKKILGLAVILVLAAAGAFAAAASHTVTMNVIAVASIGIVGGNVTFNLEPPITPGDDPTGGDPDVNPLLAYTVVGTGELAIRVECAPIPDVHNA